MQEYNFLSKEIIQGENLDEIDDLDQFVKDNVLNFSYEQIVFISRNNIIINRLPKEISDFLKIDILLEINQYFIDPDTFPLTNNNIEKIPIFFRIIYLVNFPDKIDDHIKLHFQESIDYVFKNPRRFCIDIFQFLINNWPQNINQNSIKSININEFPKIFLNDLFQKYEIFPEKLIDFKINDLILIKNDEHRLNVFRKIVQFYVENKNQDLINIIKVENLNQNETKLLINENEATSCTTFLSESQVTNIKISFLDDEEILLLLKYHKNIVSSEQIEQIRTSNSEIINSLIESSNFVGLNKEQVSCLKISEIRKDNIIKLFNIQFQYGKFNYFDPEQIPMDLNLFDPPIQLEIIQTYGQYITEDQINEIDFKKINNIEIPEFLKVLDDYEKLHFLSEEQIMEIDDLCHDSYFEIIGKLFQVPVFCEYWTNNQLKIFNVRSIPKIDLGKVKKCFLRYLIKKEECFEKIKEKQIKDIHINDLDNESIDILLRKFIENLCPGQIPYLNLNECQRYFNQLFSNYLKYFSPPQIQGINISELNDDMQIQLLNERLNDVSDRLTCFNVKNADILSILLRNKIDSLSIEQINSIDISQLCTDEKILILNNNFNKDLSEELIQKIDLVEIRDNNKQLYYNLIISKIKYLTKEQFCVIDWLEEDRELFYSIPARGFLKKNKLAIYRRIFFTKK